MLKILLPIYLIALVIMQYGCDRKTSNPLASNIVYDTIIVLDTIIDTIIKDTTPVDTIVDSLPKDTIPIDTVIQDTTPIDTTPVDTIVIIPIHRETTITIFDDPYTVAIPNATVITTYKDTVKHGITIVHDSNGTLRVRKHFIDGLHEGTMNYWTKEAQLYSSFSCSLGVHSGLCKIWYTTTGNIRYVQTFVVGIFKGNYSHYLDGTYQTWYENGNKQRSCTWKTLHTSASYPYATKQVVDGTDTTWYENGQVHCSQAYKENILHGYRVLYYENGNIDRYHTFDNGNIHGHFLAFDTNSRVIYDYWYYYGYRCESYAIYHDLLTGKTTR